MPQRLVKEGVIAFPSSIVNNYLVNSLRRRSEVRQESGKRNEGRSPGRRLHKTRSRGKGKLLEKETPTPLTQSQACCERDDAFAGAAHAQFATEQSVADSKKMKEPAGGNRNLAFHASPNDHDKDKETPC